MNEDGNGVTKFKRVKWLEKRNETTNKKWKWITRNIFLKLVKTTKIRKTYNL